MNKQKLIIMIGLPGSGKSTFVNNLVIKNKAFNYQIVCRDDLRLAFGNSFNPLVEPHIYAIAQTVVRALMIRKMNIVIDETNTTIKMLQLWINIAKEYDYNIRIIVLTTPVEICKLRRTDKVPEEVIDRMNSQLTDLLFYLHTNDELIDRVDFFNSEGEAQC